MPAASKIVRAVFGAHGQLTVGCVFVVATAFQAWWWGIGPGAPPSAVAIFWLSVEALFFASYAIVSGALGYRATERVEEHVRRTS